MLLPGEVGEETRAACGLEVEAQPGFRSAVEAGDGVGLVQHAQKESASDEGTDGQAVAQGTFRRRR